MTRRRCCLVDYAQAWWVSGDSSGAPSIQLRKNLSLAELTDDTSVMVQVSHSALNYKDALALTGAPGVVRSLPMIPGIDAIGQVITSPDSRFAVGDRVVLTGWGYGESRHGGLATILSANPDHLLSLPEALTAHQAAAFGTAGLTAALAVHSLEKAGLGPGELPIAVTGAAGAVGSFAVFFLARHGFSVTAITGRTDESDYLQALGATEVISRQEVLAWPARALMTERFGGAIDQAGGALLATVLASTESNGVVASCGLAGGAELHTTVMPFILRGVSLVGINSVFQPQDVRAQLWEEVASLSNQIPWDEMTQTVGLDAVEATAKRVLAGATRGRVVVEMPA